MTLKNLGIAAAVVLALVALIVAVFKPSTLQQITNNPPFGNAGPDVTSEYFNLNGIYMYPRTTGLASATTTPCVIKSPGVTTTLEAIVMNVTTPTSSAATLTLATSTVPNATTSLIASLSLAAGAQGSVHWHGGTNNSLVAPNTYVSFGASGVSQGGYTLGGTCTALFHGVGIGR